MPFSFDAPRREVCVVRRQSTSTPLQPLVLLNDPQFVEAARRLAQEALEAGSRPEGRADFMARRLLSRPLRPEEVRVVRASGLPHRTDAMFTTIEGEWDECFAVVKQAVEAVAKGAPRVSVSLKADVRPGVTGALTAKVEHIERVLDA